MHVLVRSRCLQAVFSRQVSDATLCISCRFSIQHRYFSTLRLVLQANAPFTLSRGFGDIDVQQKLQDVQGLTENVKARKMDININEICCQFEKFQQLESREANLIKQKRENALAMKFLLTQKPAQFELKKQEIINKGKELRLLTKQLLSSDYQFLHQQLMNNLARLPNDLHSSTPKQDLTIEEFGSHKAVSVCNKTHIDIAIKSNCLFFRDVSAGAYYLANELAILEQTLTIHISNCLRRVGIEQMSCPDLVKSFIAEGCSIGKAQTYAVEGTDVECGESNDYRQRQLLLTGVSCSSFAAFLSSMIVKNNVLPRQFYSVGRTYTRGYVKEFGLYAVPQATSLNMFGAGRSVTEAETIFDSFLKVFCDVYVSLDLPTKFVQVAAHNLLPMESKRVDVYVWSLAFQDYFKSGELSLCSDYISRRLAMKYSESVTNVATAKPLFTVHGVIAKVPSVIACLVEANQSVIDVFKQN